MFKQNNMRVNKTYAILAAILLCMACDRFPERALQQAGENREELEKVLAHFKHDHDPLKYRAAKRVSRIRFIGATMETALRLETTTN